MQITWRTNASLSLESKTQLEGLLVFISMKIFDIGIKSAAQRGCKFSRLEKSRKTNVSKVPQNIKFREVRFLAGYNELIVIIGVAYIE